MEKPESLSKSDYNLIHKDVAKKNHFEVDTADSFEKGLKKISSANKKLIVCLGSLYNIGNILNKNYR